MTKIEFHPEAQSELENALRWYRERNQIAGRAFLTEILRALKNIAATADAWPRTRANERRFVLKRFPYSIIYRIRENEYSLPRLLINGDFRVTGTHAISGCDPQVILTE